MDGLVDAAELCVDLQADVVDRLRAFRPDHGVLLEHDLGRHSVDSVAESLDRPVHKAVLEGHDDDDHVGLPLHRELLVHRDKRRLQILWSRRSD